MSKQVMKRAPRRGDNKRESKGSTRVYVDPQAFPPSILEKTSIVSPHREDKIFTVARAALIQHNRKSLQNFTDPLHIEAISSGATVYGSTETNETTLAIQYRDSSYLVPFKLVRSKGGKFELMCEVKGGWQKFKDWLDGLEAPPGRIGRGDKAYQAQFNWWSKNGKTFRFWDLPPELRIHHFYKNYTPDEVSMQRWFGFPRWLWSRPNMLFQTPILFAPRGKEVDPARKNIHKADFALLMTCKQVKSELLDYIWQQCTKYFEETHMFHAFLQHELTTPTVFNALRFLELDLSHLEYINLFRVPLQPFRDLERFGCDGAADDLKGLTGLRELTLLFRSPMDGQLTDPWSYTGKYRGYDWYCGWDGRGDRDGFTVSCQRAIVDWILTAAHKYIKHIPKVNLEGAIKNSTKLRWDMILAEEKEGTAHDMTAALHAIGSLPDDSLPPPCNCSTPCEWSNYSAVAHYDKCPFHRCWCKSRKSLVPGLLRQIKQEYKFDFED